MKYKKDKEREIFGLYAKDKTVNHWEHVLVSIKHQVAQFPNSPDRREFLPEMGNVTMSRHIQFGQFCSNVQEQAFCKVVWYMNMCVFYNGKGMFLENNKNPCGESQIVGYEWVSSIQYGNKTPLLYIVLL